MSDGYIGAAPIAPYVGDGSFLAHISRYIGETVTVFTTSGGESGSGFTGVLTLVTPEYVRIVTAIGFPPECSLGNACDFEGVYGKGRCGRDGYGFGFGGGYGGRFGYGRRFSPLGSVVDIPVARIASFAHNAI